MSETIRPFRVAHRQFTLSSRQVEHATRGVLPEPLRDHYVIVGRRRYPPKQVLALVTGLDRAEFTTHHARRILTGLGFAAGRRPAQPVHAASTSKAAPPARSEPEHVSVATRPSAETLEPFVGQWVATKGPEVLVAAREPRTVVGWLAEHAQTSDSMFRVPGEPVEATGLAPL